MIIVVIIMMIINNNNYRRYDICDNMMINKINAYPYYIFFYMIVI